MVDMSTLDSYQLKIKSVLQYLETEKLKGNDALNDVIQTI